MCGCRGDTQVRCMLELSLKVKNRSKFYWEVIASVNSEVIMGVYSITVSRSIDILKRVVR